MRDGDASAVGLRGTVLRLGERVPRIHPRAYVAPGAVVAGDVTLDEDASVWPGCVLRGDYGAIRIGARTNVQDGSVIHATEHLATDIGADVVIGHGARLEGCTVDDAALVGMGAIVLHECRVGSGALVGAGAVVSPRTVVPPGATALGVPARVRPAEDAAAAERRAEHHRLVAAHYVENARRWMAQAVADGEGVARP